VGALCSPSLRTRFVPGHVRHTSQAVQAQEGAAPVKPAEPGPEDCCQVRSHLRDKRLAPLCVCTVRSIALPPGRVCARHTASQAHRRVRVAEFVRGVRVERVLAGAARV